MAVGSGSNYHQLIGSCDKAEDIAGKACRAIYQQNIALSSG